MATKADGPGPSPDPDEPETPGPISIGGILRFLETVLFCCLAGVCVFWAADRAREVGFDPVAVPVCMPGECGEPPVGEDPLGTLTGAFERRGVVAFSSFNACQFAADLLIARGETEETAQVLSMLEDRGTLAMSPLEEGAVVLSPGPANDGFGDVVRDAFRWQGPRGCYPARYAPIFWPLLLGWGGLILWRMWRRGQVLDEAG